MGNVAKIDDGANTTKSLGNHQVLVYGDLKFLPVDFLLVKRYRARCYLANITIIIKQLSFT